MDTPLTDFDLEHLKFVDSIRNAFSSSMEEYLVCGWLLSRSGITNANGTRLPVAVMKSVSQFAGLKSIHRHFHVCMAKAEVQYQKWSLGTKNVENGDWLRWLMHCDSSTKPIDTLALT